MTFNGNKLWGISLAVLIPLAVIGVAFVVFIAVKLYRLSNPYLDREVSGPVTLTSEWLEIVPEEPLRPERQVQQIMLDVEKPIKASNDSWDLILPDGSRVIPEVQLRDQYGNTYSLAEPSFNIKPSSRVVLRGFSLRTLPNDRSYNMVRIRSDKPVRVSRIIWRSYDPQDRK